MFDAACFSQAVRALCGCVCLWLCAFPPAHVLLQVSWLQEAMAAAETSKAQAQSSLAPIATQAAAGAVDPNTQRGVYGAQAVWRRVLLGCCCC